MQVISIDFRARYHSYTWIPRVLFQGILGNLHAHDLATQPSKGLAPGAWGGGGGPGFEVLKV